MSHAPSTQPTLATPGPLVPHDVLQLPHVAVLERSDSQPGALVQSAQPSSQGALHVPSVHAATVCGGIGHGAPQPPQCATLVLVAVSQPLVMVPSQSPKSA
jgi:hypothetical protein